MATSSRARLVAVKADAIRTPTLEVTGGSQVVPLEPYRSPAKGLAIPATGQDRSALPDYIARRRREAVSAAWVHQERLSNMNYPGEWALSL
jgi:hypothetical protein